MTALLKLAWPDLRNARDLGGLPTLDGRATRTEALVRSDTLRRLRPEGWQDLAGYGIRTIIDLRDTALVEREPYEHQELAYHHIPLLPFVLLALCDVHTHAIDSDFRASLPGDDANAPAIV